MADDKQPDNNFEQDSFTFWKKQIQAAETWLQKFHDKGERIVRRYRDEDREYQDGRRYNILYANTETILPVLYSSPPETDARARDPKSIAMRKGAAVIEETVDYYVENGGLHESALKSVKDMLLPGLGTIRVKYIPTTAKEEITLEDTTEELERVVFEDLKFEYVHWKDYIFPEGACFSDRPWEGYKTLMTQEEAEEMFGAEKAATLKYEVIHVDDKNKKPTQDRTAIKKATVYEIWDKTHREQIFYSDRPENTLLEINEDPLELDNFYPTPDPLLAVTSNETMIPVPFYIQYQDQAMELDEVHARIANLVENMKRRGFYDAAVKELGNLEAMGDNTFWPIENWSEFSTKGGMQGAVSFEDITVYTQVLAVLQERALSLLQEIYQIIGISDIMRAQTDPRETLGAQQMKGKYGTIRISTNQRKVANFLRDVLAIAGEIIINQFDPETVAIVTNRSLETITEEVPDEQGQPSVNVIEVGVKDLLDGLKNKAPSDVVIDIQSDSTIIEDTEQDRKVAAEAIAAFTEFSNVAPSLVETMGLPAVGEILIGIVQKFKLGRDIQQEVEDHVANVIANPPEEGPSDAQIEAQSNVQIKQLDVQLEMAKIQADAALKKVELQLKQQTNLIKAAEVGAKAQLEQERLDLEAIDRVINMKAVEAEAANPEDNAVVGA